MTAKWKSSLNLKKALDIAVSLESAIRQAAAMQNEIQKGNAHVNVFKLNKSFHVSIVEENTVSRYVHSSIKNVFIVKIKDIPKKYVKGKPLKMLRKRTS